MVTDEPTLRSFLDEEPEARWRVGRPHRLLLVGVPIGWLITAGIVWMVVARAASEGTASAIVLVIELLFEGLWTVVGPVLVCTFMLVVELGQLALGRPSWAVGPSRFLVVDRRGRSLCVSFDRLDYVALGPKLGRGMPVPAVPFDARGRQIIRDALAGAAGPAFIAALRERLEARGWRLGAAERLVPPAAEHAAPAER